jgi:hypothetical protein
MNVAGAEATFEQRQQAQTVMADFMKRPVLYLIGRISVNDVGNMKSRGS